MIHIKTTLKKNYSDPQIIWALRVTTLQATRKSEFNLKLVLCIQGSLISVSVDSTKHGLYNTVVFTTEKKSEHKWTHMVQTHAVQGPSVPPFFNAAVPFLGNNAAVLTKLLCKVLYRDVYDYSVDNSKVGGRTKVNIHQQSNSGINYNNYTIKYYATPKRVTRILSVE